MKIRYSFISNSSSSSFIIIGKAIINELELTNIFNNFKKVLVLIENGGTSGDCEDWVAELTQKQFNKLEKTKWFQIRKDRGDVYLFDTSIKGTFRFNEVVGKYEFYDENFNQLVCREILKDYSSPNSNKEFNEFIKEITAYE